MNKIMVLIMIVFSSSVIAGDWTLTPDKKFYRIFTGDTPQSIEVCLVNNPNNLNVRVTYDHNNGGGSSKLEGCSVFNSKRVSVIYRGGSGLVEGTYEYISN